MAITIFRLMSGVTIPFDLSPTTTVGEARQRIANKYDMAVGRICLFNPTSHASLDDRTTIGLEVQVVMFSLDPEAEHRAEAAFLLACGAADMKSLIPKTELAIRDSILYKLPESIGELAALQTLTLVRNEISSLPEAIGQLTMLKILNLNANQLSSLPENIGQLTRLHTFYLENNQLTSLPETIGQLTMLQILKLNANQLSSLPETIGHLTKLQELDVRQNAITKRPKPRRYCNVVVGQ